MHSFFKLATYNKQAVLQENSKYPPQAGKQVHIGVDPTVVSQDATWINRNHCGRSQCTDLH